MSLSRYEGNVLLISDALEVINKGSELFITANKETLEEHALDFVSNIDDHIMTFAGDIDNATIVLLSSVTDKVFSKKIVCNRTATCNVCSEIRQFILNLFEDTAEMKLF